MLLFVGTMVYLLPLVVEAVEDVDEVYLQTATTLGATRGSSCGTCSSRAACPPSARPCG